LKLLSYLRFDVVIAWVKLGKHRFKCVNLLDFEFSLTENVNAFHHFDQPSARFGRLSAKKKRLPPLFQHVFPRNHDAALDNVNSAGHWNSAQQYVRPNPAGAPRAGGQRFSLLDNLWDKKVLWDDADVPNGCATRVIAE
jgi:hypothetical protein